MAGSFEDQLAGGKILVAWGLVQVGMKVTVKAVRHAIGLAYEMVPYPGRGTMKYYAITDAGLQMCQRVSETDRNGYSELPCAYDVDQATEFVMNWLGSMIDLDKRQIIGGSNFHRFAGDAGVGGDGSDYPDNFILVAHDGSGFTIRPAWMYYPK